MLNDSETSHKLGIKPCKDTLLCKIRYLNVTITHPLKILQISCCGKVINI